MSAFFDSNVLVYVADQRESGKHRIATEFKSLGLVLSDAELVKRALQIKRRYDIQFYDSMMIAAAERAGCDEIMSEDLSDGQSYFGVTARNPFKDAS